MSYIKERAMIVDWTLYSANEQVRDFVAQRADHCRLVLLVENPATNDFDHDVHSDIEWDAVIRNTGALDNVKFKTTALNVLIDVSNLDVVVGLDSSAPVQRMYKANKVLVTSEDLV